MNEGPFGEEVRGGSSTVSDAACTITVGRLHPFPVYVVAVRSPAGKRSRVFLGWRRAVRWANSEWKGE